MSYTEEIECTKVAISHVIGPGGKTVSSLKEENDVDIEIIDGPKVKITGEEANVKKAAEKVRAILEEQANPDYEGEEGKRLRAEANAAGDARTAKKEEADAAFAAGNKDEGHKLMAEAKELGEKMHATNKLAAAAIVKRNNEDKGKGDDYLDLHGLRTEEALEVTNARLDALEAKATGHVTELELIPGAGHHSAPGKVALKPATEDLLKKRGIEYEDATAGSFTVKVVGKNAEAKPEAEAEAKPAEGESKPAESEAKPAESEAKPAETKPAESEAKPAEAKPAEENKTENKSCCLIM